MNFDGAYDVSSVDIQQRIRGANPIVEMSKDFELEFSTGEKRTGVGHYQMLIYSVQNMY